MGYVARGVAYSSFLAVSVISFVLPTPTLEAIGLETARILPTVLDVMPYLWGGLMLVGALACLIGVLSRTWVGEFIGLAPIMLCIVALAVAQLFYGVLFNGVLLIGLSGILLYRWHVVRIEKSHAVVRNRQRQGWHTWYPTQDK